MRIVVIGGGSVGLLLAGRLRLGGYRVQLVTRSKGQAIALRQNGLMIRTMDGILQQVGMEATALTDGLPVAKLYLLAVKQPDLPTVLPALSQLSGTARVIALQNGMGHGEALEEILSPDSLFFAVNTEGSRRLSTWEVEQTGRGLLRIGPFLKRPLTDAVIKAFVRAANSSDIQAVYVDEMNLFMWRKLLANALINPLTALFDVRNGVLTLSSVTLRLMRQLFDEASRVAERCGQEINESDWQEILTICQNTSQNYSSMVQDLRNGKQTEIESINGYLVKMGKKVSVSTPLHETLRQAILLKEQIRKGVLSEYPQ